MELKEAVRKAKEHIAEVFKDEGITDIGLEEVQADWEDDDAPKDRVWYVTVGFTRPWDMPGAFGLANGLPRRRTYKTVGIADGDGRIVSLRNREVA